MLRNCNSASLATYNSIFASFGQWFVDDIVRPVLYFVQTSLYVAAVLLHQIVVAILYVWAIIWMLSVHMTVRLSVFVISKLSAMQQVKTHESSFKLPVNSQLLNQVVKIFQCLQWNINPAQFAKFFSNPQAMQNFGSVFKNLFKMVFKVQF